MEQTETIEIGVCFDPFMVFVCNFGDEQKDLAMNVRSVMAFQVCNGIIGMNVMWCLLAMNVMWCLLAIKQFVEYFR